MFISHDEAEERLRGDRNLFKDRFAPSAPVPESAQLPDVPIVEDGQEVPAPGPIQQETIEMRRARKHAEALAAEERGEEYEDKNAALDRILEKAGASRDLGPKWRTTEQQAAIAETALLIGTDSTSEMFGLSKGRVTELHDRLVDPSKIKETKNSAELKAALEVTRKRLGVIASQRLESALNVLTEDKIKQVKEMTDVAKIAKDMAIIMDKVTPTAKIEDEGGIHFHLYKPEIHQDNHYETVEVGAVLKDDSRPVIDVSPSEPSQSNA